MIRIAVLCVIAGLATSQPLRAEDDPLKAAQDKVNEYLKGINGQERARVTPVKDEAVAKAFPKHSFVAVVYPQFPVARPSPEPLKSANVFAVPAGDGKVAPLTDAKELEAFFKAQAPKVAPSGTSDVLKAWLRLSAELAQDGFYKFKDPEVVSATGEKTGDGQVKGQVDGKIAVDPAGGNKGEITAKIWFKNGSIEKIDHKVNLSPGPRPRCQATKLLDADPIVRQMAEDSIRVMGSRAKYYLDEQRAKASPELQKAIDRIWQRILDEGR